MTSRPPRVVLPLQVAIQADNKEEGMEVVEEEDMVATRIQTTARATRDRSSIRAKGREGIMDTLSTHNHLKDGSHRRLA